MPRKYYKTYQEALEARRRKQRQFPNFYVKIKSVKVAGRNKFYIVVS